MCIEVIFMDIKLLHLNYITVFIFLTERLAVKKWESIMFGKLVLSGNDSVQLLEEKIHVATHYFMVRYLNVLFEEFNCFELF